MVCLFIWVIDIILRAKKKCFFQKSILLIYGLDKTSILGNEFWQIYTPIVTTTIIFPSSQKIPSYPYSVNTPYSLPDISHPEQSLIWFLSLQIHFTYSRISHKWNHIVCTFRIWLLSLKVTFLEFTHVPEFIMRMSVVCSFRYSIAFHCVWLCHHLPVNGYLGCFQFGSHYE